MIEPFLELSQEAQVLIQDQDQELDTPRYLSCKQENNTDIWPVVPRMVRFIHALLATCVERRDTTRAVAPCAPKQERE